MKQVSLPKKFEMYKNDFPFVHDEKWISNGKFAVKKDLVKDCFKYCSNKERAIVDIQRIVPLETHSEWVKTDTLFDSGENGYLRVFERKESSETVCFKEDYIKHFELETMKGNEPHNAFISDDDSVILMPCRHPKTSLNYYG